MNEPDAEVENIKDSSEHVIFYVHMNFYITLKIFNITYFIQYQMPHKFQAFC